MSDPRKKVKQHAASIRTSVNNIEGRLIDLLNTYSPDTEEVEQFYNSVFTDNDPTAFAGRRKYVQTLVLMHYYLKCLRDTLDMYDLIV